MAAHEAEIYAAVDAAKEAAHLHRLLQDLGERSTAAQVLMGDNKPSVTAQQNFTDCTQSKHIPGAENNKKGKELPGAPSKKSTPSRTRSFPQKENLW